MIERPGLTASPADKVGDVLPYRSGALAASRDHYVATATLCQGALLRAVASGIPPYDTLFVELAVRSACPLLTFDKAVLRAFPKIAIRPRQLSHR